jgi:hypothetical protein
MPNLVDYVLDNPDVKFRIIKYLHHFMVSTGALYVLAAVIYCVYVPA